MCLRESTPRISPSPPHFCPPTLSPDGAQYRPEDLQYACVTILNMNPDSPSRQALYHTLLDLYLSPAGSSTAGGAAAAQAAASSSAAQPAAAAAAGPGPGSSGGGGGESNQSAAGAAAAGGDRGQRGAAPAAGSSNQQEALDLLR